MCELLACSQEPDNWEQPQMENHMH